MPQISVLPLNELGQDKLIGDVHGHGNLFKILVENKITSQDRMFVVGDLFDRGHDPITVFQVLQDHPNIYVTRGNHEDILLNACRPGATAEEVVLCLRNGGQWILADGPQAVEIQNYLEKCRQLQLPQYDWDGEYLQQLFNKSNKIDQLGCILRYIENLPYIIQVGQLAEGGFYVCHADMLFSDQDLQDLIANPKNLTFAQIDHLTWARTRHWGAEEYEGPFFAEGKRSALSMLVYCGHSIISNETVCIRENTNHINIDSGAYLHDCFVLVNHTVGKAEVVCLEQESDKSDKFATNRDKYRRVAQRISMYLKDTIILPRQSNLINAHICSIQSNIEDLRSCSLTKTGELPSKYRALIQTISGILLECKGWVDDLEKHVSRLERAIEQCQNSLDMTMFESGSCCSTFWQPEVKVMDDPATTHLTAMQDSLSEIQSYLKQVNTRKREDKHIGQQSHGKPGFTMG